MNLLITGGAGFLGQRLAASLLQKGTLSGPDGRCATNSIAKKGMRFLGPITDHSTVMQSKLLLFSCHGFLLVRFLVPQVSYGLWELNLKVPQLSGVNVITHHREDRPNVVSDALVIA